MGPKNHPHRRNVAALIGAGLGSVAVIGLNFPTLDITRAYAHRGARVVSGAVDLGTGDIGVLNYAYALEQLEAAFYTQVLARSYAGMTGPEQAILQQIQAHEVAHRDYFRDALGGAGIPALQVDFTQVNFSSRTSVLTTARTFEDLGVSAYNGAGALLRDPAHLAAAGSIVSVEARHAAAIRNLLRPGTGYFAGDDVVNGQGLDVARPPHAVLPLAGPFIATRVSASGLA